MIDWKRWCVVIATLARDIEERSAGRVQHARGEGEGIKKVRSARVNQREVIM